MFRTGFLILFILGSSPLRAQEDTVAHMPSHKYDLKFMYVSSLIYPGAGVGVNYLIKRKIIRGAELRPDAIIPSKDRYLSANLNWYHHSEFHDNIYLTVEWVMQKTKPSGYISEFSSGPGFSHTFNGGTTYKIDDSGNVSISRLAGYNFALLTIGGGFGYDFSVKKNLPYLIFGKMNMICMFPYNSTLYLRPVLELGIRYRLNRKPANPAKEKIS